jgi:uncharacterized protein
MILRAVITLLTWICLTSAVAAQTLTFPVLTGRVVDGAGLLTSSDQAAITQSLADLEAKTTDQLVVVTVKSLDGISIDDYGYQLGRAWGIGQKRKDSGVLLIVAPNEKSVRIEVGYGLEGTLTDATSKIIIANSILPEFKSGDFPGGIKSGVAEIIKVLDGDAAGAAQPASPNASQAGAQDQAAIPVWAAILLGLGGVGLLILCTVSRGRGACRILLQVLFMMMLAGRGGTSRGKSSWSGGGGSFGGGGSSGSW